MRTPTEPSVSKRTAGRRGAVLVYSILALSAMLTVSSVAVDFGRVTITHSELQTACDAAARYGASGLKNIITGTSAASANAVLAAAANKADGTPVVLDPLNDVQLVIWDTSAHTYTVTTDPTLANAVRVVARRTSARGNATQLLFGAIFGRPSFDLTVSSIAMLSGGTNVPYTVPATSNPFLAGMPAGSTASLNNPHNSPDYAGNSTDPRQSPVYASGTTVRPGSTLSFDGVNGAATNDKNDTNRYTADGNTSLVIHNTNGNENGIADINNSSGTGGSPINSLVGVFLSDDAPNLTPAPAMGDGTTYSAPDASTDSARNFSTLKPALKQIFFIGDGRDNYGSVQNFVVPPGATRLYIATWDAYEWNNNVGSFSCTIHNNGAVSLVK